MSHSTIDNSAGVTLTDQKVLIYNTDTQDTQIYDGDNVLLKGDTVFITTQSAEKIAYKTLSQKKVADNECFIAVKAMPNCDKGGAAKKRRKTIKASELGPEFMALMTMNADIDNRLLQHATRSFKKKHAIDNDTYIDYDYLDVIGTDDGDDVNGIEGGAKKKKRTTTKRRKSKKATKKAFNMDVDEYEQMLEDVILDKDVDALGDIEVDKVTIKDFSNDDLSGSGNIFDKLGSQFVTQKATILGGGDKLIAQCECDANLLYEELVNRGAYLKKHCGAMPDKCDCEEKKKAERKANDDVTATVLAVVSDMSGGAKKKTAKKQKHKRTKRAEDFLSSSSESSSNDSISDSYNGGDNDNSISDVNDVDNTSTNDNSIAEVSADNDIVIDTDTGTGLMYF